MAQVPYLFKKQPVDYERVVWSGQLSRQEREQGTHLGRLKPTTGVVQSRKCQIVNLLVPTLLFFS